MLKTLRGGSLRQPDQLNPFSTKSLSTGGNLSIRSAGQGLDGEAGKSQHR